MRQYKGGWEEYVAAICNFYGPDEVEEEESRWCGKLSKLHRDRDS